MFGADDKSITNITNQLLEVGVDRKLRAEDDTRHITGVLGLQ